MRILRDISFPFVCFFVSKRLLLFFFGILFLILFLPLFWIYFSTYGKIFSPEDAPSERVAIVFGAAIWGNYPSDIFADRLLTAADLYHAGKVEKILVSGDNSEVAHNEPRVGEMFLREQGIPAEKITIDYAGFRTFDTCARAKKVFGVDSAILVTQAFHLPRAIFLCEKNDITSFGVKADRHEYRGKMRNFFRENAAKVWAFFEVMLFFHEPKFLGEPVEM